MSEPNQCGAAELSGNRCFVTALGCTPFGIKDLDPSFNVPAMPSCLCYCQMLNR